LQQRFAAGFFYDQSGNDEVGVAVLPLGSGIEIERLAGPEVENFVGVYGLQHEGRNIILGPVILIAGGVGEQLADGDLVAAGEIGDEAGDGIVERKFAVLREKKYGGGGKLFADGTDAVAHCGRGGRGWVDASVAVGVEIGDGSVLDDGDGGARDPGGGDGLSDGGIDFFAQGWGDGWRGLGSKRGSG
jgi:hypothetical protein